MRTDKHHTASIQAFIKSMPHVVAHSGSSSGTPWLLRIFIKFKHAWRSVPQLRREHAATMIAAETRSSSLSAQVRYEYRMLDELPRNLTAGKGVRRPRFALLSLPNLVAKLCALHVPPPEDSSNELHWNVRKMDGIVDRCPLLFQVLSNILNSLITDPPAASKILGDLTMTPEAPNSRSLPTVI